MPICYAEQNPVYVPAMRLIANITQAFPSVITTTFAHGYVSGQFVRINLPPYRGMSQINGALTEITVIDDTTVSIPIDTRGFDAYVTADPDPVPRVRECSQIIPSGHRTDVFNAAVRNILV